MWVHLITTEKLVGATSVQVEALAGVIFAPTRVVLEAPDRKTLYAPTRVSIEAPSREGELAK